MRAICRRRRAPEVHKVLIENSILASNRDGRKAIALGIKSPATEVVEMAAHVGFDAVALDGEHGALEGLLEADPVGALVLHDQQHTAEHDDRENLAYIKAADRWFDGNNDDQ